MDDAIRLATVDDAALLTRLQIDFDTEFDSPVPDEPVLRARYRALLADPDGFALLAGTPDSPTGFATLTLRPTIYCDGPLAVLDELYVVPGLRDRGIGTALLLAAIAEVRARGGGEMHINVDEIDVDTRRFYERHGFVNIEPGTDYRMLCYIRELGSR
ncbi:putative acetyltransferase [Gordonia araii NBRC 100433]|uniref:Putative acetyltransferase n=1 Tax=Gordonia araii NBRC 100433 TaxID=1073574 RepID=G7H2Q4_9ACTN|nr:GNAT family N-acetyltransferase [Gordonia araii]NNG98545.1 GNAT family N-acetyltransferase [Gordonia araii NBRC 100433]GAB10129.1 putative acetyltransferase [Gordonia araii NBRC 100433]